MDQIQLQPNTKWPHQHAAILSDSSNMHMLLRELVRSFGWKIPEMPQGISDCIAKINLGSAFMVIVDDSPDYPLVEALRALTSDPIGRLTPILAFLSEPNKKHMENFRRTFSIEAVEKPLTPSRFTPAMRRIFQTWENPLYFAVRKCAYGIINGHLDTIFPVLQKLAAEGPASPLALQSVVSILAQKGEHKEAERLIIAAVKKNPKNLQNLLTAGQFYLQNSMPKAAYRIFSTLKFQVGDSTMFHPDLAHLKILLGDVPGAIDLLKEMIKAHGASPRILGFLARLMISEGFEPLQEGQFTGLKAIYRKYLESWEKEEAQASGLVVPPAAPVLGQAS